MIFTPLSLKGAFVIEPRVFSDDRGMFYRYFCKNDFKEIGHDAEWVQLNHSVTLHAGTVRGMHYQLPPFAEIKLVKCIAGSVLDVIVDVRKDSPTFLQWVSVELSADNRKMIYIPAGFAHGFQAMENNSQLIYHHTAFYTPGHEAGIRYNDPRVNIQWPLAANHVSERDETHPLLTGSFNGIK